MEARDDAFNSGTLEVTVTVTGQNEGPEISGVQSLSFAENLEEGRVLAAYTATDPEDPGAVISRWSLSGSDAGDFTVSEGGELSFRNVPDFERPADSGRDNVYNFSVRASDGRNYGYLEVTVTVEDVNEAPDITTTSKDLLHLSGEQHRDDLHLPRHRPRAGRHQLVAVRTRRRRLRHL